MPNFYTIHTDHWLMNECNVRVIQSPHSHSQKFFGLPHHQRPSKYVRSLKQLNSHNIMKGGFFFKCYTCYESKIGRVFETNLYVAKIATSRLWRKSRKGLFIIHNIFILASKLITHCLLINIFCLIKWLHKYYFEPNIYFDKIKTMN